MRYELIEKTVGQIREILNQNALSRAELVNIIAQTVLEIGVAIYISMEGGRWDSEASVEDDPEVMKRIAKEHINDPGLGKALLLMAAGLREMYFLYLEEQNGNEGG